MEKLRVWRPIRTRIKSLNAQEAFMIWLKAGLITGAILSSPYMFWHIWWFVAAGLYPHERRYVYVYMPFSIGLFLAGAAMAFFFVFEPVLDFLFSFNRAMQIDPDPRISEWIGFVLFLPVGFGIAFQLPLVMLFVNRIGVFTVEAYVEKWRVAMLVIFVISMLLTPADPISMLMMAGPLTVLYFLGIALCKWMPQSRSPFSEAYEP
ncbi:MAG: twin-arginine translocase subunit TatC [Pirellulaceae bacterium]|nr:twin-arginine translocase subunit TatC [Pirellulaceae bacterium]